MNCNERLEGIRRELDRQNEVLARAKSTLNRLGTDVTIRIPPDALEALTTTEVQPALVNGVRG